MIVQYDESLRGAMLFFCQPTYHICILVGVMLNPTDCGQSNRYRRFPEFSKQGLPAPAIEVVHQVGYIA